MHLKKRGMTCTSVYAPKSFIQDLRNFKPEQKRLFFTQAYMYFPEQAYKSTLNW